VSVSPSVKIAIWLTAAPLIAMVLGVIASDEMAIPAGEIRIGALAAAGFIVVAVACGSLLKRRT
jgi:hypothetical protein